MDTGVHNVLAKFLAHDISFAKHAKPEDHLGAWGSFMFGVTCLGFFLSFSTSSRSTPNVCGAGNVLSVSEKL